MLDGSELKHAFLVHILTLIHTHACVLPGALLPVINQSYLVWNLLFAALVMRTRCVRRHLDALRCTGLESSPLPIMMHVRCAFMGLRGAGPLQLLVTC